MKKKLLRYSYNERSEFIIQEGKSIYNDVKKNWSKFFKNKNPLFIELGCGYGEHTTRFSFLEKDKNFIGIDIKGARIYKGAISLKKNKTTNAIFLRTDIQNIDDFFNPNQISGILISFPDPRPKKRDIKKRLTNINFLNKYYGLLKKGGELLLKTDDKQLFDFTIGELKKSSFKDIKLYNDIHINDSVHKLSSVITKYEKRFINEGKKIKLLSCFK